MTKIQRSSDVGKVFWLSLLVVFLLCGAALLAFKFRPVTAAGSYAAIVAWVCVVAFCALVLRLISKANDLLQALVAMWRPIVLVLAAAWLLFVNDQGRELGVSLMGEKQYLAHRFFVSCAHLLGDEQLAHRAARPERPRHDHDGGLIQQSAREGVATL